MARALRQPAETAAGGYVSPPRVRGVAASPGGIQMSLNDRSSSMKVAVVPFLLLALAVPAAVTAAPPETDEPDTKIISSDERPYTPSNRAQRRIRTPLSDVSRTLIERLPTAGFENALHEYLRFEAIPDWSQRQALLRRGVIVRPMAGFGLPDYVRITVGTEPENRRLVEALRAVREAGAA